MMSKRNRIRAFILAGGASARMGGDKALLEIGGVPMVLRTARLLEPLCGCGAVTVIGPPERYADLRLPVVPDDVTGQGPLGGIATALRATECDWNLMVGCDLPYLTAEWIAHVIERALESDADAVLPQSETGGALHAEPLCAAYHRRLAEPVAEALSRGVRKITDALAGHTVLMIPPTEWKAFDSSGRLFKNMNSPEDYAEAVAALSAEEER